MNIASSLMATCVLTACVLTSAAAVQAQDVDTPPPAAVEDRPIGRFVKLTSPIDDRTRGKVKTAALELRLAAENEGRDAILILELTPGTSQFHHVLALAKDLSANELVRVKTVCWVPESVTGYNAIVAWACDEVVMHPDAELGDFGRGEALAEDERAFVDRLAKRRGQLKRPAALAAAMADPGEQLLQVDVETPGDGGAARTERRLVLRDEAKTLRDNGVVIRDTRTVSENGTALLLSAEEARRLGVLYDRTAESPDEVALQYNVPLETFRPKFAGEPPKRVRMIPVKGVIDTLLASFLSRQIDRAVADGADMIIFDVESPGGLKMASQELAEKIADLSDRDIRTVAWVEREAISGAAIISLGCDQIIMRPDAMIGDAGAISMNEDGAFDRVPEKIVSPFRVEMANLAERKGRPPAILMAMVDRNLEVYEVTHAVNGRTWYMTEDEIHTAGEEWVQGRLVPESRKGDLLLTADGDRAHELKISEPSAADFEEVRQRLGIAPDQRIRVVERTWVDDTVVVLNSPFIIGFLFFIGIMCIYLELHTMTGFFAIGAVLCFALYFWSHILGGTAGALEVVMFLLGFALIALEVFVIPGIGVAGLTGGLLVLGSLIMAAQTFSGLDGSLSLAETGKTLGQLGAAIVGVIVTGSLMSRFLPKIPLFSDMVLAPPGAGVTDSEVRLRPELADDALEGVPPVGATGVAATTLRPSGKARIDHVLVDVVSEGPFITADTPIEVCHTEGRRVVVREIRGDV